MLARSNWLNVLGMASATMPRVRQGVDPAAPIYASSDCPDLPLDALGVGLQQGLLIARIQVLHPEQLGGVLRVVGIQRLNLAGQHHGVDQPG